ncbi:VanZ domain protein [Venturia nashicola]|uniref:VanZ domain protein n=1 Tax=Venturia nashicola TaxID=86259 RepID=A0A4Z1NYZ6_9PEZI|nr:VanZ domain protein [Venturia nashicola]TLD19412.1 VanZ domain protein [Venturia nashicola]
MRIRQPPAIAFGVLFLASAYLGLAPSTIPSYGQSDKVLHFVTFFLLTLSFYWILEIGRRRNLHITFFACTLVLGVGSEIVQGLLPNGRLFDPLDILANVFGSLLALALNTWYHKRMLERKRASKHYNLVPGEDEGVLDEDIDLELGERSNPANREGQESGVVRGASTLEQEVDNWDENAEDWDEDGDEPTTTEGDEPITPDNEEEIVGLGDEGGMKRAD